MTSRASTTDRPSQCRPKAIQNRTAWLLASRFMPYVTKVYGLSAETAVTHGLGLDWNRDGPWIHFPVRDQSGVIVNNRRRYVGPKPELHASGHKYRNLTGRGEPRLYLAHELRPEGGPLIVTGGEFKALILQQLGIAAVSSTGGVSNWPAEWDDLASRFDVTVVYDRGEEVYADALGRRLGAQVLYLPRHLAPRVDLSDLAREHGHDWLRRFIEEGRR